MGAREGQETENHISQNVDPKSHLEAEKEQKGMERMRNLRDMLIIIPAYKCPFLQLDAQGA